MIMNMQTRQITFFSWVFIAVLCGGISYGLFIGLNNAELDRLELENSFKPLWGYWGIFFLAWLGLTYFTRRLCSDKKTTFQSTHHKDHFWSAGSLILICSLMLRLGLSLTPQPRLSTDIWRYLQDGATICQGVNPYEIPPAQVDLEKLSKPRREIIDRINHPDLASIYLPTSQWVFAGLWSIKPAGDLWGDHTFRLGFGILDCVTILFLLLILKRMGKSAWWVAIYGLHPLALTEVAASGHQDVIGVCFLVMSLYFGSREKIRYRDGFLVGICLGLSIWVKPIAALAVVPLVATHWGEYKAIFFALIGGIVASLGVWLPLFLLEGSSAGLFVTAKAFSGDWSFNGPIHYVINTYLIPTHGKWFASGVALMTVASSIFLYLKRQNTSKQKIEMIAGCCICFILTSLLMTSTCHPWYLIWLIALLPLSFDKASWVWSLTIVWSYAFYQLKTEDQTGAILLVTGLEFLPVYSVIISRWISRPHTAAKTIN